MKGYIYKVTNKVTGKSYIGQTRYTVEFRWRQHQHKKDNTYFHNSIKKYGVENFIVETLEECDYDKLNEREIYYIAKYNTFKEGYNLTIGGDGNRRLQLDNKYDEIKELYLSGFSSNKIATLYRVDKATIVKILKSLNVKLRNNKLNINKQEFNELVEDYHNGYSLVSLAKRYDCDTKSLREFLKRNNVDLNIKYRILEDQQGQENLIREYSEGVRMSDLCLKYKCGYSTFRKILSINGIKYKGKHIFKLNDNECLQVIDCFNRGIAVKDIAKKFKVDKTTIYSLLKRYHVNYLTV